MSVVFNKHLRLLLVCFLMTQLNPLTVAKAAGVDPRIEAEEAAADADAALAEAKESRRKADEERKRRDKIKDEANAAIAKAKSLEEQAKNDQAKAENEVVKYKAESDELLKQTKLAEEKQVLAKKTNRCCYRKNK
jgi:hypothetical protein